ncbi:MAG: hypothetical protein ABRQ39_23920 [Candidatus Eremiobacterota bacterium]
MNISELAYKYAKEIPNENKDSLAELVLASVKFDLSKEKIIFEISMVQYSKEDLKYIKNKIYTEELKNWLKKEFLADEEYQELEKFYTKQNISKIKSTREDLNRFSRDQILMFARKLRDFITAIEKKFPSYDKGNIKDEEIWNFYEKSLKIMDIFFKYVETKEKRHQAINKFKSTLIKLEGIEDKFEALSHIASAYANISSLKEVLKELADIVLNHSWTDSKKFINLIWTYIEASNYGWKPVDTNEYKLSSYNVGFKSNVHRFKKFNHSLFLVDNKDGLYEKIALLAKSLNYKEQEKIIDVINYWTYLVAQKDIESFKDYIFKEIKLAEAESISF